MEVYLAIDLIWDQIWNQIWDLSILSLLTDRDLILMGVQLLWILTKVL